MTRYFILPVIFLFILLCGCKRHFSTLEELRDEHIVQDKNWLVSHEPESERAYTLDEMIQLALCHNLELMVKEQEADVAKEQAFGSLLRTLPNLIGTYGNTIRDKNTASFSESLIPGIPPAPLSISMEQGILQWNVLLSWSTLDFGVAFFRSRQDENRYVIKELQVCRARNKLILDVVQAFWKVAAIKKWMNLAEEFLERTAIYKKRTMDHLEKRWLSDLTALESSKRLIDVEKDLMINTREYHTAKMTLANLIGFNPCSDFDIVMPEFAWEEICIDECEVLEEMALKNRIELYEKDMEGEVTREQVREALVQFLPSFRGYGGANFNSNRFFLFNEWLNAGYEIAWNLLQAPYWWQQQMVGITTLRKITAERLATSLAVVVQVELSRLLIEDFNTEYRLYKEDYDVKRQLSEAADRRLRTGEFHEMQAIYYEADALLAEIDALKAFASLQGAIEQLNNSIGIPLYYGSHP